MTSREKGDAPTGAVKNMLVFKVKFALANYIERLVEEGILIKMLDGECRYKGPEWNDAIVAAKFTKETGDFVNASNVAGMRKELVGQLKRGGANNPQKPQLKLRIERLEKQVDWLIDMVVILLQDREAVTAGKSSTLVEHKVKSFAELGTLMKSQELPTPVDELLKSWEDS